MNKKLEHYEFMEGSSSREGQLPFYIGIHAYPTTVLNYHSFVEFTYIIDGSGYQSINGTLHRMEPGTISFLPPYHIHQMTSDNGCVIRKYCCLFDMNLLFGSPYASEWTEQLYQIGTVFPSSVAFCGEEAAKMKNLFAQLLMEYRNPEPRGRNHMICNKLSEALILFLRIAAAGDPAAKPNEREDGNSLFWTALHYVHAHYTERLTLDMVAKYLHISETYVSRMFREKTGRSFLVYVHQLRINSAASMLIMTDRTIMDIAFDTGFESPRTFYRVFKEIKGQSPKEYRNANLCRPGLS
ncbi:AraC family transcriptional regulator [Paenibacillus ginsengarvi]|uniref:AraC family transcriptional regulator n=1 Tax=Paenibacillus ginsengarvi TaxID=400777 RepID=A0A3B0C4U5_9BACL|nr:AraC family transcriptional regulator [Paenibacillus ginsengarvi]RKN78286.1 AraC family transcriptional regulator [Paenibacillus ginsengarvi]